MGYRVSARWGLVRVLCVLPALWGATALAWDAEEITTRNGDAVLLIVAGDDEGAVLQGSGCMVDAAAGLALTTAHQVRGVSQVKGITQSNAEFVFEIIAVDEARDLAVLRSGHPLPTAVSLGDPDRLKPGGDVVAISSPQGIAFSTHIGHVTNTRFERNGMHVLLTDLPLTAGSSGGPVFDETGRLIGLVSGRIDEVSTTVVVPVTQARGLLCGAGSTLALCSERALEEPLVPVPSGGDGGEVEAVAAYNRGVRSSDPGEKIELYRKATMIRPAFYEAWYNMGVAFAGRGDWEGAVAAYRSACELRPDAPRVRRNLGQALLRAGQTAAGAAQLETAVKLAPDDERAHNDLGEAYRRLERYDAAAAAFEKSLHLRPDYPAAHFNLGLTLVRLGRTADAVPHFEAYLSEVPEAEDAREVRQLIDELKTKDPSK